MLGLHQPLNSPHFYSLWRHWHVTQSCPSCRHPAAFTPFSPSDSSKFRFNFSHLLQVGPPTRSELGSAHPWTPLIFEKRVRARCGSVSAELWARDLSNLFPRAITATVSSFERLGWGRRHQGICAIRTESALTCATTSLHLSMGGSWWKIGPMQDSGLPLHTCTAQY